MLTKLSWCLLRSQQKTVETPQGNEHCTAGCSSPPPCSSLCSLPGKGTPTFPQMGRRFKPGRPDGVFSLLAAVLYCTIPLVRHVRLSFSSPHGWHVLQQGPYCYFRLSLCVRQICARKVCFVSGSVIVK